MSQLQSESSDRRYGHALQAPASMIWKCQNIRTTQEACTIRPKANSLTTFGGYGDDNMNS